MSCGLRFGFHSLQKYEPIETINDHGSSITQAFESGTISAQVLEGFLCFGIERYIELQQYHSEVATWQYEIVTGPFLLYRQLHARDCANDFSWIAVCFIQNYESMF